MKDKESLLLSTTCFFAGIVVGFLIAPIKKGVYCGNHSGNQYKELKEKIEEKINVEEMELSSDIKI